MPRLRTAQTNFTGGEVSPELLARSDTKFYANGAESLQNMEMLFEGGVQTRPGLEYKGTIPYSPYRLAPFVFNEDQKYIISFSNGRADIFDSTFAVVATLTSAPWTTAMLDELNWAQFGDTMFLVHEDMPPQVITRTGASSFTFAAYAFETEIDASNNDTVYQPFYKYAAGDMTLAFSGGDAAYGDSRTLTLSSPGAFTANHVGTYVRWFPTSSSQGQWLITAVASATSATATATRAIDGGGARANWDEQAFSAVRGYPRTVEFFGDRLIFGGARDLPSRIWISKIGAYYNFDLGTGLANEAIWDGIASRRVSQIKHMLGFRHLLVFCDRALFYIPQSPSRPLTPENFQILEQHPYGINEARPALFDGASLFVQSSGTSVREGYWVDTDQAYKADSISGVSSHLIDMPARMDVTYGSQDGQEQHAYFVNDDGTLAVFTSVREQDVAGWAPWVTEGSFEDVVSWGDRMFVGVSRTVNSSTVHFLEEFDQTVAPLDATKRATSGTATRTFSAAFTHLASQAVHVMSKGHYLGTATINGSGDLVLDDELPEVTEVEVGFAYDWEVKPLPIDIEFQDGKTRGLMKRLVRAWFILHESASLKVQRQTVLVDLQGDDYDTVANTITGVREVRLLGVSREAQFTLTSDTPQRVRILGITREVEIYR